MNETDFIRQIGKKIKKNKNVIVGIGDDAAVLDYDKRYHMLFASDMLIEAVHFKNNERPFLIGRKAAAVNISDIAAMGGEPKYLTVSIGLPRNRFKSHAKRILKGADSVARRFGAVIVGGDTNLSEKIVVHISIIGLVEKGKAVTRSGAKTGDLIFVSGRLGLGKKKHLSFTPRVKMARALTDVSGVSSMIDISDGLFLDLARLCRASGKGCMVYEERIPVIGDTKDPVKEASGGEDFELLFTLPPKEAVKAVKAKNLKDDDLFFIGEITERKKGMRILKKNGKINKIGQKGYLHFK